MDQNSFYEISRVRSYILRIRQNANITDRVPIVLVGNFADCPNDQRQITTQEGKGISKSIYLYLYIYIYIWIHIDIESTGKNGMKCNPMLDTYIYTFLPSLYLDLAITFECPFFESVGIDPANTTVHDVFSEVIRDIYLLDKAREEGSKKLVMTPLVRDARY